jgi:uncharacterized membrane protein
MLKDAWTDERVESIIGKFLRIGVTMAAGVVGIGGIVYLFRHGFDLVQYSVFRGEPSDLRNGAGILKGVFAFQGRSVIQLGVLMLIATPVLRVAFSVLAFGLQRDRAYVLITFLVLGILLFSLAGGAPGA